MPQDAVIEGQIVLHKERFGDPDVVLVQSHIAPSSQEVEGAAEHDPHKENNEALALYCLRFLRTRFPVAYGWKVEADIAQGILKIKLSLLMPETAWHVINLHRGPGLGEAIVEACGSLLERYLLPRDKFDLAALLAARAKHSALIMPWKTVPV